MAHNLENSKPLGGLNYDDSDLQINHSSGGGPLAWQDYRYAKNIRNAVNSAARGKALTNVKSTVEITKYLLPYTVSFPAGKNKVIGTLEDTKYNTVIFCVWNSNGNHQILRYYRNNTDPVNPYGEVQQVMCYNFGWTRKTRITDMQIVYGTVTTSLEVADQPGDLLYWSDPVPKKINLSKANICNKHKTWRIYAPSSFQAFANAGNFQLLFQDINNTVLFGASIDTPAGLTNEEGLVYIADRLNQSYGTYVSAEACGCKLIIEEKNTAVFYASIGGGLPLKMYADNWYGTTLVDRFFDRCKWLPGQAPQPLFGQDTNNDRNYVKQKVFQFRLGYRYDDLEDSCLGVWSQIATNNLGCDGTSNELFNYVDVDFNDPALVDDTTLILLKEVKFVVRELNTGTNKLVITTTPCDYLDWNQADQKWYCHYKFYNDILSTPIDANTAAQLFDDVPLESGAELFTKNRIVEGAIKTGYDAPDCVEATYEIEAQPAPLSKIHKITGKIRILTYGLAREIAGGGEGDSFENFFPDDFKYPFWQPPKVNSWNGTLGNFGYPLLRGGIFHDTSRNPDTPGGNFAFFGGGSYSDSSNNSFGIRSGMETDFDQRIPEGGFPIYAAGTSYLTISKQLNVGLATDSSGALDTSNNARISAIGKYLYNDNDVPFDLYSTFELNVPDGVYVIRPASHWCSFGDKLGKGFAYNLSAGTQYQKTSTNVWAVIDSAGAWKNQKEITVTVNGGDVYIGEFVIADIAPPKDADISTGSDRDYWQGINAYLVDDFGDTELNNANFLGIAVEKTLVFYGGYVWTGAIATPLPVTGIVELGVLYSRACLTDHNGYWFGIGGYYINPESPPLTNEQSYNKWQITATSNTIIRRTDTTIGTGTVSDYLNKQLNVINFDAANSDGSDVAWGIGLIYGFVATNSANSRSSSARIYEGYVKNQNGLAVSNVPVVFQNGRVVNTSLQGFYQAIGWYDANSENQARYSLPSIQAWRPALGRDGLLIFSVIVFCDVTYPNGQTKYISIATISYSVHYIVTLFTVNEDDTILGKAHKSGGKWLYGLRYNDGPGRLCSVVKGFEAYAPFVTEDLNVLATLPNYHNPAQYPPGTFIQGKRLVKWFLDALSKPPEWAATYQWMRTRNTIYGRYLQWVANEVTYLSAVATTITPEIKTSFQNVDAVAVKISISNIVDYSAQNNNSNVGYQYQAGDRARLIADRNLVYYEGINDFEVTSYSLDDQSIIIKPNGFALELKSGMLFEIFNPKSVATEDEQIFYEVGEVFECTNPGHPDNAHGTLQGTFSNGDTYWHGRLITVNDPSTKFAAAYAAVIESASLSDFYISEAQDIGRVGTIDPNFKQIELPTGGRSSGQFLPGTASNGLSTFDPNLMPTFEADRRYDRIQRMFFEQNNLMLICSNKEVSNYINRQTLYQAESNTGIVSLSGEFFGTQFIHAQNLGTDLPATTVTDSGKIFGWRNNIANVWVYRGDGEKVISDEKMITFFDKLREDGVADAVAVYDRYHEEYIITYARKYKAYVPMAIFTDNTVTVVFDTLPDFAVDADVDIQIPPISAQVNWTTVEGVVTAITIIEGKYWVTITADNNINLPSPRVQQIIFLNVIYSLPETIAFYQGSDELREPGVTERWKTFYDFTPENYSALGQELIGFVNGKPWIFNKNDALRNNFFGVQFESSITPVFNEQPAFMKVFNAIWQKSTQADNLNNWHSPRITNIYGQLSRLKAANFKKQENNWYVPFLRDLNTTVVQNPILNGRALRSEALEVEFKNDYTGEVVLYGWRCNYTLSERTSK